MINQVYVFEFCFILTHFFTRVFHIGVGEGLVGDLNDTGSDKKDADEVELEHMEHVSHRLRNPHHLKNNEIYWLNQVPRRLDFCYLQVLDLKSRKIRRLRQHQMQKNSFFNNST